MKRVHSLSIRCLALLLLAVGASLLSGCASTESENTSSRPWNTPQIWENGMPSGLYEGR